MRNRLLYLNAGKSMTAMNSRAFLDFPRCLETWIIKSASQQRVSNGRIFPVEGRVGGAGAFDSVSRNVAKFMRGSFIVCCGGAGGLIALVDFCRHYLSNEMYEFSRDGNSNRSPSYVFKVLGARLCISRDYKAIQFVKFWLPCTLQARVCVHFSISGFHGFATPHFTVDFCFFTAFNVSRLFDECSFEKTF